MLKQRLRERKPVFGTFAKVPAPAVIEVLGLAGFDFVVIDLEHGTLGYTELENLVRAAQSVGMEAVVRVPDTQRSTILRSLDVGSDGIQVPMVESAASVEQIAAAAYYPPAGSRGLALSHRAIRYGFTPAKEYIAAANDRTVVVAQVETPAGVAAAEAVAAIPGLDVLFIGPTDLSLSLGVLGEREHPHYLAAVETTVGAAQRHGKAAGTLVGTRAEAEAALRAGFSYILWGTELGLLAKSAREARAVWSDLTGA